MSAELFVNTAVTHPFISLIQNGSVTKHATLDVSKSEHVLGIIAHILEDNKLQPSDINKITYVNGPGSFTGLRIVASILKVWKSMKSTPVYRVSNFQYLDACASESTHSAVIFAGLTSVFLSNNGVYCGKCTLEEASSMLAPGDLVIIDTRNDLKEIYQNTFMTQKIIFADEIPHTDVITKLLSHAVLDEIIDPDYHVLPHITQSKKK